MTSSASTQSEVGQRVREFRQIRRISVRQLAALVGTSPSFISQLENGRTNASVKILAKIATALDVHIGDLFSEDAVSSARVLRRADRPLIEVGDGVAKSLVTRRPFQHLEAYEVELSPNATLGEGITYGDTHALIIVIAGRASVVIDGVEELLDEGDSLEFGTASPHTVTHAGGDSLRALIVLSPPVRAVGDA